MASAFGCKVCGGAGFAFGLAADLGDLKRQNKLGWKSGLKAAGKNLVDGALGAGAGKFGASTAKNLAKMKGWNAGRNQVKMNRRGSKEAAKVHKKTKQKAYAAVSRGTPQKWGKTGGGLMSEVNGWR